MRRTVAFLRAIGVAMAGLGVLALLGRIAGLHEVHAEAAFWVGVFGFACLGAAIMSEARE